MKNIFIYFCTVLCMSGSLIAQEPTNENPSEIPADKMKDKLEKGKDKAKEKLKEAKDKFGNFFKV